MKNYFFIWILISVGAFSVNGQNVTFVEDIAIEELLQKHISQNRSTTTIEGWRVQLLATTDRLKVEREETKFLGNHPEIYIGWEHNKPYYKLRAGAFASKLGATRLLKELKAEYPSAFLSKDEIKISELLDK